MRRFAGVVVVLLLSTLSTKVRAQEDPACAATDDTTTLFQRARENFEAERYDASYGCYKKHWDIRESYDVAANLGNLEVSQLKKYADGATHLHYARENLPASMPAAKRSEVKAKINERLGEALAHVQVLELTVLPRDAEVVIDGQSAGRAPLRMPIYLEPGTHSLLVQLAGHAPIEKSIDAKAGTKEAFELTLTADLPSDGEATAPAGLPTPAPAADEGSPALGIAVLATGGAAAVAGVILIVLSAGAGSDTEALTTEIQSDPAAPSENPCGAGPAPHPKCGDLDAAAGDQITFRNAGIAAVAIGGALLVTGTVLLLVSGGGEAEELAIRVGPGAISISGRF